MSGIVEWQPWDSSRLDWWDEDKLDPILAGGAYGVKVRTAEELEAALKAPAGVAPTKQVWIHEALEDGARRVWERGLTS